MKEVVLSCEARDTLGKGASRRSRQQGKIPGIVYGKGTKASPITVDGRTLSHLLAQGLTGKIVRLKVADGEQGTIEKTAVVKEVQRDFTKGNVIHVDFQEVSLADKIVTKVPVVLVGEDRRTNDGGILEHALWELEIQATPMDIPEKVEVDVSGLRIGDVIKAAECNVGPNVKILTDPDTPVVSILSPTKAEEEAPKEAAEEAETPETEAEARE